MNAATQAMFLAEYEALCRKHKMFIDFYNESWSEFTIDEGLELVSLTSKCEGAFKDAIRHMH